jgi:hypothetical protein
MDFLKKHYEKVLLGVVLLGLAVAVAFLYVKSASEQEELENKSNSLLRPKVKPLAPLDLSTNETSLKRLASAALVDFSTTNKLFNPMPWLKAADNRLIRSDKAGPTAATIAKTTPLYLKLTFDSVTTSADGTPKYVMGVEKAASPKPSERTKKTTVCKLNDKNDTFKLIAVQGPPENPTGLTLELNDASKPVTVTKEVPFTRVDGYMADIKYDPEKLNFSNCRVGRTLHFNAEDYIIVAISENEVVLSAKSNQKKWTIKSNAAS